MLSLHFHCRVHMNAVAAHYFTYLLLFFPASVKCNINPVYSVKLFLLFALRTTNSPVFRSISGCENQLLFVLIKKTISLEWLLSSQKTTICEYIYVYDVYLKANLNFLCQNIMKYINNPEAT